MLGKKIFNCFPLLLGKITKSKTDPWLSPWAPLLPSLFYFSVSLPYKLCFIPDAVLPYGHREFVRAVPTDYKFLHPISIFNLLTPALLSGLRWSLISSGKLSLKSKVKIRWMFLFSDIYLSCIYASTSVNIWRKSVLHHHKCRDYICFY